jgi:hypothetical protein
MVDDSVDGETAAKGRWAKEIDRLTPLLNQNYRTLFHKCMIASLFGLGSSLATRRTTAKE